MRVLSIGNSFSWDAHRYLHEIAAQEKVNLTTANLFIGGCSLRMHYLNMLGDKTAYELQFNGQSTGIKVGLRQVLESDEWDVITLQQASHLSAHEDTYFPYIESLAQYVRTYCPKAKLYIHQTWAYEKGSERLQTVGGFENPLQMLQSLQKSYKQAAEKINADKIIPCGQAMYNATQMGIEKMHRDTFHASLGAGRYLLGLTWYKALLDKDIAHNAFVAFDEEVTQAEREIIVKAVNAAFGEENK